MRKVTDSVDGQYADEWGTATVNNATCIDASVQTGWVEPMHAGQLQIVSLTAGDSFKTLTSNQTIETQRDSAN